MNTPKFGTFIGVIADIIVNIGSKPAIFTRVNTTPESETKELVTHRIMLDNPVNTRIGFDEMRNAFPEELGSLDDTALLSRLLTDTSRFEGRKVHVAVEPQLDATTRLPVKGPQGQTYFNVRLRSNARNLTPDKAGTLAEHLLSKAAARAEAEEALAH